MSTTEDVPIRREWPHRGRPGGWNTRRAVPHPRTERSIQRNGRTRTDGRISPCDQDRTVPPGARCSTLRTAGNVAHRIWPGHRLRSGSQAAHSDRLRFMVGPELRSGVRRTTRRTLVPGYAGGCRRVKGRGGFNDHRNLRHRRAVLVGHIAVTRRYPVSDASNSQSRRSASYCWCCGPSHSFLRCSPRPPERLSPSFYWPFPISRRSRSAAVCWRPARDLLCRKTQSLQPESELREEPSCG